ncbi:MAG: hypothetical protein OEV33_00135, partial [Armatimonadota bacterium]|nr:hypothetical protein [Armatimonadota bacterium]
MTPLVDMEKDSLTERVRELRAGVLVSAGEFHQWFDLWAESLAETAGEPMVGRRARAFAHMLDHMDIELPRGALIVGRHPKTVTDEETRRRLWSEWVAVATPPEDGEVHFQDEGLFRSPLLALHVAPGAKKAVEVGFGGIREGIQAKLD